MIPTRRDDADDATPTTTRAMEDATTADATTADGRDATTDDEMNRTNRSVPRATSVREKIALYDGADEAAKARTRANDEETTPNTPSTAPAFRLSTSIFSANASDEEPPPLFSLPPPPSRGGDASVVVGSSSSSSSSPMMMFFCASCVSADKRQQGEKRKETPKFRVSTKREENC